MIGSIFPVHSFDRSLSRWEERSLELSPVEVRETCAWKREDYFAPLGYGGINGAKLRQCIWLTQGAVARGARRMFTGASVKSPQLSMGTAVARHFGIPSTLVIGSPNMRSARQHPNVMIAEMLGAEFAHSRVAYNPALQKMTRELAARDAAPFTLEYGITVEGDAQVEAFHRLGAEQVRNVPGNVEELFLPAGSCNTCVSVLYGLALHPPEGLRRVTLFGIGPTRLDFIDRRLRIIEKVSGVAVRSLFQRLFHDHPAVAEQQNYASSAGAFTWRWRLEHYDLHSTGFAGYQDERPFVLDGIELHPTYEGKVLTYLASDRARFSHFWRGGARALFWIVGSRPRPEVMIPHVRAAVDSL